MKKNLFYYLFAVICSVKCVLNFDKNSYTLNFLLYLHDFSSIN